MLSEKPLKIPLFLMASGRSEVDPLLGISIEQLTRQVPFRHIPHRHDFYHLFWIESGNGTFVTDGRSFPQANRRAGPRTRIVQGCQKRGWPVSEDLPGFALYLS